MLNALQWDQLQNDIYLSVAPASRNGLNNFSDKQIAADGKGSYWESAALRSAPIQNHELSFKGGDEKSRYLILGNYFNQEGTVLNTDFQRYSGKTGAFNSNANRDTLYPIPQTEINLNHNLTQNPGWN